MRHQGATAVWIVAIAVLLVGCDRNERRSSTRAPSASYVKIVSVSPDITTALKVGEKVKLQVEVNYRLSSDRGTVSLVVQAANNANLGQNMEVIQRGNGKAILSAEFVVPDSSAVQIFTPLQAQGQTSTSTVDYRAYKVIK
jgi:hypothetical protein